MVVDPKKYSLAYSELLRAIHEYKRDSKLDVKTEGTIGESLNLDASDIKNICDFIEIHHP